MLPDEPTLRHLSVADAAACTALANRVHWSHNVATWERCISWAGENALCLALGDQIITTALLTRYSDKLAWIGMVVTDPDYQGRGYAKRLMLTAIDLLTKAPTEAIMLDASSLGLPVYLKLGFRSLYPVEIWEGTAHSAQVTSPAEIVQADDLADIIALDAALMGAERPAVVRDMAEPGICWLTRENGRLSGYLLAQRDNRGVHIGSWYHESPDGARNLLQTALNACDGQPIRLQVPQPNRAALEIIQQMGWTHSRSGTRMVYAGKPPGRMAEHYGIMGFASG